MGRRNRGRGRVRGRDGNGGEHGKGNREREREDGGWEGGVNGERIGRTNRRRGRGKKIAEIIIIIGTEEEGRWEGRGSDNKVAISNVA